MNRAARKVVDRLTPIVSGAWVDGGWLSRSVQELAAETSPHDPEVVAAWCRFLDFPVVWERVRSAPRPVLLRALLEVDALPVHVAEPAHGVVGTLSAAVRSLVTPPDDTVRPEVKPCLAVALRLVVMAEPSTLEALSPPERARVEPLVIDGGGRLPAVSWTNPWTQKVTKRKPKIIALAPHEERVHGPRRSVPDAPEHDRLLEEEWNAQRYHSLFTLLPMGDSTAVRLFRALDVSKVWLGDASWVSEELKELVPRFGLDGLDASLRVVEHGRSQLAALLPIESGRVAPVMAEGLSSRQPAVTRAARTWLTNYPETAAVGVVPLVLAGGKLAPLAIEALKLISRAAPVECERGLRRYPAEVVEAVIELRDAPPPLPSRRPALPDFFSPLELPRPIALDGASALHGDDLIGFVQLLKVTPLDGAPWIDDAKARFSVRSLASLSRTLFELWLLNGAPPKEKWMLQAVAHFGDAEVAEELARRAAQLAPKGLSARAQEMAEVLGAMRTKESLALLHGLSKKVRSKAFRARAELVFTSTAEKLGLTQDELAERLVPDFGLSPDGALPLEPPIRLDLTGGKVRLVNAEGAVVKSLPSSGDEERDEELAALKKKVPGLVKDAIDRLERRLTTEARMSLEHFTEVYAMHGVMAGLARQVLWGQWREGQLVRTFTLERGAPVDVTGAPVNLVTSDAVGVVHPLHLDEAARAAWTKRVSSPFHQLDRKVHRFTDASAYAKELRAFEGQTVQAGQLLSMERLGWIRGEQVGGGCYVELTKPLSRGRARLTFMPGIYLGDPLLHRDQTIDTFQLEVTHGAPVELSDLLESARQTLGANLVRR